MDFDTVRFRIDAEVRRKAADVCAEQGTELHQVLRAFITQIARDGALPFKHGNPSDAPARSPASSSTSYDAPLWASLKPRLNAELAIRLLIRFIADRSQQIDEAPNATEADREALARLHKERSDALAMRRDLDPADAYAVTKIITTYGPLVRQARS